MIRAKLLIFSVVSLLLFNECGSENGKKKALSDKEKNTENTIQSSGTKDTPVEKNKEIKKEEIKEEAILLNDQNAIPFFFDYQKQNLEDKVRITTRFGNIDLQLFKNIPYHRANFIYLTKKGYFNGTTFHRVVPGFIIQGGNSDRMETAKKRAEIGKYLLPPDTRKGYKHHRGVISMPSSEIENPHKLASPYEFFIVQVLDKMDVIHLDLLQIDKICSARRFGSLIF